MNLSTLLAPSPLDPACALIVTIPARNEEAVICDVLDSLADQTTPLGFGTIVFANNCDDATAETARRFAERNPCLRLSIAQGRLHAPFDNVGCARKALMDYAAESFFAADMPRGIVATTDADTCVAKDWVEKTVVEMRGVDAVAGLVEIGPVERDRLPRAVSELYAKENAFRRAWAELEALVDPLPEDPSPRHCSFVGASFAVTAEMYRRAGGLPALAALEDREFLRTLRRVDARIRFSRQVRAFTSGRHDARVDGGFGTLMKHLHRQGTQTQPFMVESPDQILQEARRRAALRRIWAGSREELDMVEAANAFGMSADRVLELLDGGRPFGENYETLLRATGAPHAHPLVPIEASIDGLRAAAAALKARAPTRRSTASGAG